jgi:type IV pilus assembly protein PilO
VNIQAFSFNTLRAQFEGLEGRHPGLWPPLPRLLCPLLTALLVIIVGGWLVWSVQWEALESGAESEGKLRTEFERKVAQAQHLDVLRKQKAQVEAQVLQQQRQLPGKSEIDALLAEISQAGAVRGLQFELFKPGQLKIGEHYAELPIEIRLSGSYHALAGFVSDVANMSRIVTIDRITLTQLREGVLAFECLAHTFQYLDAVEAEQKKQRTPERKQQVLR